MNLLKQKNKNSNDYITCVSAAGHHLSGLFVRHLLRRLHLVSDVQRDEKKGHPSASHRRQEHVTSLATILLPGPALTTLNKPGGRTG